MNGKEFKQWIWRKDYISHSERIAFDPAYADVEYKIKRKMETRKCKTCGLELPISEFSACTLSKDGLQTSCKQCMSNKRQGGWIKKAKAIAEAEAQPLTESERIKPTVKPEALKARLEKKNEAQHAEVEAYNIGEIPDWILSAELRRRGYIVKVYKECDL